MKSFIQFLREGVIDEPPKFYEGKHPHETFNNYDWKRRQNKIDSDLVDPQYRSRFFTSDHEYFDPESGIQTSIVMRHANDLHPNYLSDPYQQSGHAGVAVGSRPLSNRENAWPYNKPSYADLSANGDTFKMPGDIIKDINVGREHLHDFIQKMTPSGLNTITYSTPDPKRQALYQKQAEQYPHLTFRNDTNIVPTKRLPKIGLGAKLGIAGAVLGLATGANAADLLHGLHPLSVLDGGSLGTDDVLKHDEDKESDYDPARYQMPTTTPIDQLPQNSHLNNITKPLSQWNNH